MLSVQITDQKKLTEMLFASNSFDKFLLHDAEFVTSVSVTIEGRKHAAFFDETERAENMKEEYVSWSEERPMCLQLLKGKRLPLSFHVVLLTASDTTAHMKKASGFTDCEVTSLSLNILYRDSALCLTTGIAYSGFTMDKSLEKYWDDSVRNFLNSKECAFTEI